MSRNAAVKVLVFTLGRKESRPGARVKTRVTTALPGLLSVRERPSVLRRRVRGVRGASRGGAGLAALPGARDALPAAHLPRARVAEHRPRRLPGPEGAVPD